MSEEKPVTIGEILKEKRQKLKLSLLEVSSALKVRKNLIDSIEQDDFSVIDKNFYTVGFIRSYAKFLKIENSEIDEVIKEIKAGKHDSYKNKLQDHDLSLDKNLFYKSFATVALIIVGLLIVFNLSSNDKLYEEKVNNFTDQFIEQ